MNRQYLITVPIGPGAQDWLGHTLESIAVQKPRVRIALCHAGAQDEIETVIAPYRHLFAHERHGPDAGQSAAINEGWTSAPGDVLGWLNADDALAPDALEIVDDMLDRHPDAAAVCGQSHILDGAGHITGLHPVVKAPDEDLFRSNVISQPSCFVTRDALQAIGYVREGLHYAMDWDLWVRLMEQGVRFAYTPDVLSSVIWSRDTKTASFGWARVKELHEVVSRRGKPLTTAKTLLGFAMHHLSEYSQVSGALKPLNARLRHGKRGAASYWGADATAALTSLKIFHYSPEGRADLHLMFPEAGERSVSVNGAPVAAEGRQELRLPLALASGKIAQVEIGAAAPASAYPLKAVTVPVEAGAGNTGTVPQASHV